MPDLVLEKGGKIFIEHTGWCFEITAGTLEEVAAEDIRKAKGWPADLDVYLSGIREVPEDLLFADRHNWAREWWIEYVRTLEQKQPIAQASKQIIQRASCQHLEEERWQPRL